MQGLIPEDDGSGTVDEHTILHMVAHPAGESEALAIAAEADEILRIMVVLHAGNLLFNDGTGIQLLRGIVAGGADELHAALESLPVGICPDESGKKGVVDIHDPSGKFLTERGRHDLHEAGEDDELHGILAQEPAKLTESFLAIRGEVEVYEFQALAFHQGAADFVIGNHDRNVDADFPGTPAPQKINQAVVLFADEDGGACLLRSAPDGPFRTQGLSEGGEA